MKFPWATRQHRLFSFISQNWRAQPLVSYRVIVDLISATTTDTGLKVHCELDTNAYPKGITLSDDEMDAINITRAEFHGEWNYTIRPTAVRFAELGFSKRRVWIRDFAGSLLGRI